MMRLARVCSFFRLAKARRALINRNLALVDVGRIEDNTAAARQCQAAHTENSKTRI